MMIDQNTLSRYKQILSIAEENINIVRDQFLTREAELDFDISTISWIIYYKNTQSEFPIIHELGHIYFATKKTNYMYFASPPPRNPELNHTIGNLINNLLDCFINYSLTVFDEIYPIIKQNNFIFLDNIINFQRNIRRIKDLHVLLGWYNLFYLEFRFILKEEDRDMRNEEINSFLAILKNQIYSFTDFNQNDVEELTDNLNRFNGVKNEIDALKIILFIFNVVFKAKLWTDEELKKQIKLFFP